MSLRPIGGVLSGLLHELGLEQEMVGWRAVGEWPVAVGPRLARRTRAVAFRAGTLVVEVEGSSWLHELGFLKRDLLKRINRTLAVPAESAAVRDLKFVMARGGIRG